MKKRRGLVAFVFVLVLSSTAFASQIANHIRAAYMAMDDQRTPPMIRDILRNNMQSYAAGAAGPDILTNLAGRHSVMARLAHYERTSDLITNMLWLLSQGKDPNTESYLAYVLGWLTHGYVDIFEHGVVNQYGGYYQIEENQAWHLNMELFETGHVYATCFNPKCSYVAEARWFPFALVKSAYILTYGTLGISGSVGFSPAELIGQVFDSGVLHTEAYAMEYFTNNFAVDHEARKRQYGLIKDVVDIKVGKMPLFLEYEAAMNPLWVGVDYFGYRSPANPAEGLQVDVTYLMNDDRLKVSYISDWYGCNEKAVTGIVGSFNRIASSIRRTETGIEIDSDVQTGMPNYNWDSGRLAGHADDDLRAIKLQPVTELALVWEITDGARVVAQDVEKLPVRNSVDSGTHSFSIPLSSDLMPASRERELQLKAALRMISQNTHLHPGSEYPMAFHFAVEPEGTRVVDATKHQIESVATKSFRQASQLARAEESAALAPEVKGVEDLLAKLREAASRSAALASRAAAVAGLAGARVAEADAALNTFDQAVTRYQSDIASLGARHAKLSAAAQEAPGLAARVIAAAQEVGAAIEQAQNAEAEACKRKQEAQLAASRAAGYARTAEAKYQEAVGLLSRIRQIQLDCANFANEQTAIAAQVQGLNQLLQAPAASLQEARRRIVELQQIQAQLQAILAEGSALYSDVVRRIDALPPAYAPWKKEAASLFGQIQSNVKSAQDLTPQLESVEQDLAAATAVLQSVVGSVTELKAPVPDANLIRDAESWVDTAELYLSRARIAAQNAARCAGNPPDPNSGDPDWDGAADSGTTIVEPDWDAAADQGSTTTSSKVAQTKERVPADPPPSDEPGQTDPRDEPDNDEPQGDDDREWAKSLTNVLIDIWNRSAGQGSNQGNNLPQNNPRERQDGQQNLGGCIISGDVRSAWQTNTWYLFKKLQQGAVLYTVTPGASENVHAAPLSTLTQIYGSVVGTYPSSAAALSAARSYCRNPMRENVYR